MKMRIETLKKIYIYVKQKELGENINKTWKMKEH